MKHRPLLCLDLEGTLISNAVSQIPRPGLYDFLRQVEARFDLMIYTSVKAKTVDEIRELLIAEKNAPSWFRDLPVIHPDKTYKPKAACGREDAYLLDDQEATIVPGEAEWWIPITEFTHPYSDGDRGLSYILDIIKEEF